jgi:Pyridoxamine 5'-phosphate oxidase
MPLFGVWLDGSLFFTAGSQTRKAKDLAKNPQCVISASWPAMDLVIEGKAVRVRDRPTLARIAEAYDSKYGWPLTIRNGAFDAPYGAPSAGPPPYEPYQFTPSVAFGLSMTEPFGATRWRFPAT